MARPPWTVSDAVNASGQLPSSHAHLKNWASSSLSMTERTRAGDILPRRRIPFGHPPRSNSTVPSSQICTLPDPPPPLPPEERISIAGDQLIRGSIVRHLGPL